MAKSETIPVTFIQKKQFVLWQYKNNKGVPIQCNPNSKGNAPKTIKGAKCSFHHHAKKIGLSKYAFSDFDGGILVIQEELLSNHNIQQKPRVDEPVKIPKSDIMRMDGVLVEQQRLV